MKTFCGVIFLSCILVACDKDESGLANDLRGQWIWESTRGGVVGCHSATAADNQTLTITDTSVTIAKHHKTNLEKACIINKVADQGGATQYEIVFADGNTWACEVLNARLTINYNSVIYSSYRK